MGIRGRVTTTIRVNGHEPRDVRILPASKTHPISMIRAAMAAGVREFGENRLRDLAAKVQELGANLRRSRSGNTGVLASLDGVSVQPGTGGRGMDLGLVPRESEAKPDVLRWMMIGNLQHNETKLTVAYTAELQNLDSLRLMETLSRLPGEVGRGLDITVQVNVPGETAKHRVELGVVLDFAGQVAALPGLCLTGFTGVTTPLLIVGEAGVHRAFAWLRAIRDVAVTSIPEVSGLSMGVNGDFKIAIAEGSTCVRLGPRLFGQRRAGIVAPVDR